MYSLSESKVRLLSNPCIEEILRNTNKLVKFYLENQGNTCFPVGLGLGNGNIPRRDRGQIVVMVVGKGNGGYRIYNWESETLNGKSGEIHSSGKYTGGDTFGS